MEQSPSARLFFGVPIEGEGSPLRASQEKDEYGSYVDDESFDDLEDYLIARAGIPDPYDKYPKLPPEIEGTHFEARQTYISEHFPEWDKELQAWRVAKKEITDSCPIELMYVGEDYWVFYAMVLKGTQVESYEWKYDPISLEDMIAKVTPESITQEQKFCEENGLPPFEKPQWFLSSNYG